MDTCQLCGKNNYSHGPHYMGVCGKCLKNMINNAPKRKKSSTEFWFGKEAAKVERLSIAAPELLEALEDIISDEGPIIGGAFNNPYVSKARAAISKARGE